MVRAVRARIWAASGLFMLMAASGVGRIEAQANSKAPTRGAAVERRAPQRDVGWERGDLQQRPGPARGGARGNGSGKVPPGWCQGVGNPHRTRENCGPVRRQDRAADLRHRDASYLRDHEAFHRELDRRYERLGAQRPFDLQNQLELRIRKRDEHDAWHARRRPH